MKQLLFIFSVLLVFFSITLITVKKEPLKIVTSPTIYSFMYSSQIESFKIPLLINKTDSFYTNEEYISSISVRSKDEIIPLTITDINVRGKKEIDDDTYYYVDFNLQIDFYSKDFLIQLEEAYLYIQYENKEELNLYIGEFNYVFNNAESKLLLGNLKATVFETNSVKSISGIQIELHNSYKENIIIKNIEFISEDVTLNNDYGIEVHKEIDMFDEISEIINLDINYLKNKQVQDVNYTIRTKQSKELFIPSTYLGDINHIHRCVIKITYMVNDQEKDLYIDDLPYISTSIFEKEYESEFYYYEY